MDTFKGQDIEKNNRDESRYKAMWGNATLYYRAKPTEKNIKITIDTINKETLFPQGKIYWKRCWEKINIDKINWQKLFDRSAEYK